MSLPKLAALSLPRSARVWVPSLAAAWALVLLARAHLWFMHPPMVVHPGDEGYIAAFAVRLLEGHMLPYVDAFDHRGPLLCWVVAVVGKIFDPMSWMPIRVCALGASVLTVLFTFGAAWRAGHALAGGIAAVAIAGTLLAGMPPLDAAAFNAEPLVNALVMPAFYSLVVGLGRPHARPRIGWVVAAGVLTGLAALAKQSAIVACAGFGLWVLAAAAGRSHLTARRRLVLVGGFVAACALPFALTVLRYAAAGKLRALWYWTVTYNVSVYMAPVTAEFRKNTIAWWLTNHVLWLGAGIIFALAAIVRAFCRVRPQEGVYARYDRLGFVATVGLQALAALAVSNVTLRNFLHYYVPVVPWASLLLGLGVKAMIGLTRATPAVRALTAHVALLVPFSALVTFAVTTRFDRYQQERDKQADWPTADLASACRDLDKLAKPGAPLFAWGFVPGLYVGCRRPPASRFVVTTLAAGVVPWFVEATPAQEDAWTVPGSRRALLNDLEKNRPPVIVDAPASLGNRSLRCYPRLNAYLAVHYCDAGPFTVGHGYLRRTSSGACPPSSSAMTPKPSCVGRHLVGPETK